MNRRTPLAAIFTLVATAALADDRTYTFECDAPPGHYVSWTATTRAAAITITGTLRINEIRHDKKKLGVVNVYFRGGADGKTTYGFRGYDADDKGELFFKVLKPGGHEDIGVKALKPGSRKIPFRMELTTSGTLHAKVGEAEQSVELGPFAPRTIDLGCSTGDFSFGDLRIAETLRE